MAKGKGKVSKSKGKKPTGKHATGDKQPAATTAKEDAHPRKACEIVEPEYCDEQLEKIRTVWDRLRPDEKAVLLKVSIQEVRDRALAEGSSSDLDCPEWSCGRSLAEVFDEALTRKREHGSWKQWYWPMTRDTFGSEAALRAHIRMQGVSTVLNSDNLPGGESKTKACAAEFRSKMCQLYQDVQAELRSHHERMCDGAARTAPSAARKTHRRARMTTEEITSETVEFHVDMIVKMMSVLSREDEQICNLVSHPIVQFMNSKLPDGHHKARYPVADRMHSNEVHYDEMSKLAPAELQELFMWVLERVDLLSKWESEPDDADPTDTLSITEDGDSLVPSATWREELLSMASAESHSKQLSVDTLLLEWVYGLVVPSKEKAVKGAKHSLYPGQKQDGTTLWSMMHSALKNNAKLTAAYQSGRELLHDMIECRKEVEELAKECPAMLTPCSQDRSAIAGSYFTEQQYSTMAVISQLKREGVLTRAKVFILKHEQDQGLLLMQKLRHEQRQGEPLYERKKKAYEDAKNSHRMVETTRNAPDAERQRQAATDAAIGEHLQAQCAYKAQGNFLQNLVNKQNQRQMENDKLDREVHSLGGWMDTVSRVFKELSVEHQKGSDTGVDQPELLGPSRHSKYRHQFFHDLRRQLYSDNDDQKFYNDVQTSLRSIGKRLHESSAAICFLKRLLFLVTCDDPGPLITMKIIRPILRQRLHDLVESHAVQQAKAAEEELLLLADTQEPAPVQGSVAKSKKKRKPKARSDSRAEQEPVRSVSELAALAREAALRKVEEEQEALREARAKQRELEEELLEKRKQELLSEENGFWRKRMEETQREKALLAQSLSDGESASPDKTQPSMEPTERHTTPPNTAADVQKAGPNCKAAWGKVQHGSQLRGGGHVNGVGKRNNTGGTDAARPHRLDSAKAAAASRSPKAETRQPAEVSEHVAGRDTTTRSYVHATLSAATQNRTPTMREGAVPATCGDVGCPVEPQPAHDDNAGAHHASEPQSQRAGSAGVAPEQAASRGKPAAVQAAQSSATPLPAMQRAPPPGPPATMQQRGNVQHAAPPAQPPAMSAQEAASHAPDAAVLPSRQAPHTSGQLQDVDVEHSAEAQASTAVRKDAEQATGQSTDMPPAPSRLAHPPNIVQGVERASSTDGAELCSSAPSVSSHHGVEVPPMPGMPAVAAIAPHAPGTHPSVMPLARPHSDVAHTQVVFPIGTDGHAAALAPPGHAMHPAMAIAAQPGVYMPHGHYGYSVVYHQPHTCSHVMATQYLTPYGVFQQPHMPVQPVPWSGNQWNAQAPAFIPTHNTGGMSPQDGGSAPAATAGHGVHVGPKPSGGVPDQWRGASDASGLGSGTMQRSASEHAQSSLRQDQAGQRITTPPPAESTGSSESCSTVTAAPEELSPPAAENVPAPPRDDDVCSPAEPTSVVEVVRPPLASIKTDAVVRNEVTVKSPGSAGSRNSRRAAKKARRDIAVLEEEHAARYMLVGGRVGLRNRQGENHCFLNVIVQALYHLKTFSSRLMRLELDNLPGRNSSHNEWRLLKSLAALFSEFETTSTEVESTESSATLSPDGLRSALPSAFANQGMHDADEVLHELFVALLHAEVGTYTPAQDPLTPVYSFLTESMAKNPASPLPKVASWANKVGAGEGAKDRFAESLTLNTFGMRVQLPGRKPAPPGKVSVERFFRFFHHVYERMLITNHQKQVSDGEKVSWAERVKMSGFDSDHTVPLLSKPSVVAIKMVWATPVAGKGHIKDVCAAMADANFLDLTKLFTCVEEPARLKLRCVIGYAHLHYVAFVQDEQLGWLELDDSTILSTGAWEDVLSRLVSNQLQPLVLFYEEF